MKIEIEITLAKILETMPIQEAVKAMVEQYSAAVLAHAVYEEIPYSLRDIIATNITIDTALNDFMASHGREKVLNACQKALNVPVLKAKGYHDCQILFNKITDHLKEHPEKAKAFAELLVRDKVIGDDLIVAAINRIGEDLQRRIVTSI